MHMPRRSCSHQQVNGSSRTTSCLRFAGTQIPTLTPPTPLRRMGRNFQYYKKQGSQLNCCGHYLFGPRRLDALTILRPLVLLVPGLNPPAAGAGAPKLLPAPAPALKLDPPELAPKLDPPEPAPKLDAPAPKPPAAGADAPTPKPLAAGADAPTPKPPPAA